MKNNINAYGKMRSVEGVELFIGMKVILTNDIKKMRKYFGDVLSFELIKMFGKTVTIKNISIQTEHLCLFEIEEDPDGHCFTKKLLSGVL